MFFSVCCYRSLPLLRIYGRTENISNGETFPILEFDTLQKYWRKLQNQDSYTLKVAKKDSLELSISKVDNVMRISKQHYL